MYGLSRRRRSSDLHFPPVSAAHVDDQLAEMKMAAYNRPLPIDFDPSLPMPGSEFSFRPGGQNSFTQLTSHERVVKYKPPPLKMRDPDTGRKFPKKDHGTYRSSDLQDVRFPIGKILNDAEEE
eukprot:3577118-Amphidinium_carterae.1